MKVSVVIPVYNEARHIGACLDALRQQTLPAAEFEVIVVDGGSTDETRALVQQARGWNDGRLRVLDNPRRTTASGLNLGLAAARGEIIARVDGHSVVPPEYLAELCATLADPAVWAAGAAVTNADPSPRAVSVWAAFTSRFGCGGSPYRQPGAVREVDSVQAAAYRREVFDRVGRFDEAMLYAEDDEFNYRVRQAGGRIVLRGDLTFGYFPRTTYAGLARQLYQYGRGRVRMLRKTGQRPRLKHLLPVGWLLLQPLVLVTPLSLLWLAGWSCYLVLLVLADPPRLLPALRIYPLLHFSYGAGMLRQFCARR